jgi:YD repeat-containing protein
LVRSGQGDKVIGPLSPRQYHPWRPGGTRTFTTDAAGNVTYDNRNGQGYGYTYDQAGRMVSFAINGIVQAEYRYNHLGQQIIRRLTQTGTTIQSVYGPDGNRTFGIQRGDRGADPAVCLAERRTDCGDRGRGDQLCAR